MKRKSVGQQVVSGAQCLLASSLSATGDSASGCTCRSLRGAGRRMVPPPWAAALALGPDSSARGDEMPSVPPGQIAANTGIRPLTGHTGSCACSRTCTRTHRHRRRRGPSGLPQPHLFTA